jgi:hypothetical protein
LIGFNTFAFICLSLFSENILKKICDNVELAVKTTKRPIASPPDKNLLEVILFPAKLFFVNSLFI